MKRDAHLADTEVQSFLRWARPFVPGDRQVIQGWRGRLGGFHCRSLSEAYRTFDWPFQRAPPR